MKKLLFLGMPGSGKGTQAKLLAEKGFKHISTGDVIREAIKSNNPEIEKYKEYMAQGGLLPDEVIFDLIEKNVSGEDKYILDGAVRTLPQAQFAKEKSLVDTVIFFTLNPEVAHKRLSDRNEGREDDRKEIITKRFREYEEKTKPIINFLKENFEFHEIDANPTIEEIHKKVLEILKLE